MKLHLLALMLGGALLAGCGGGGGDDTTPVNPGPVTPSYNASAAFHNMLTTSHAWILSGTGSDSKNYSVGVGLTPTGTGTFALDGATYSRSSQSLALAESGTSSAASNSTLYFGAGDQVKGVANDDGTCWVATPGAAVPTSAHAGDSGTLYTAVLYPGCTAGLSSNGTAVAKWSIETFDSINYFCTTTDVLSTSGVTQSRTAVCFQVNTDGSIGNQSRVTISNSSGFSLVAKN